ncbi:hypothetical protein O181_110993 [Austropuccinia psidii MF-1]|uniref:Uncharacterized protein n=1 Tax=Austropuccinia psidii MF-1 TaxID=1389203 RepID=A0A9Q3PRB6_9BASI|nr:hypothetical protein [Austropuccinia psidii MF-1]
MEALTSMMAPGVLFPSQYTSDSSISSLGGSCHQLMRGVLPLCFSPLPPSLIRMDAQSDSSDDHYSTHNEYNLPHETASASQDTRPNQSVAQDCKRQHKRSDVVKIVIMGCHTSNMNKHCKICAGWFNAWESESPGSIDPNMGARLAAETQMILNWELVKGLVAVQVSFSIFESPQLQHALQCIAPSTHDSSNCITALL